MRKRKVIGWILFVWGVLGLAGNILVWLPVLGDTTDKAAFAINTTICLVLIIKGWKLKQSAKAAE